MSDKLIIIGAGGYSAVVAEVALLCGFTVVGFADDTKPIGTLVCNSLKVVSTVSNVDNQSGYNLFVVAIGNNGYREQIYNELLSKLEAINLVHPKAIVSPSSTIGNGNVILAGAVINANTNIGNNNIINSLVLIDHDTVIQNNCHIAQGTIVGSNVNVGDNYTSDLGSGISSFSMLE